MTCLVETPNVNELPSTNALAALTASATARSAPLELWPVIFRGFLKLRGYPRTFATVSRAAAASASTV